MIKKKSSYQQDPFARRESEKYKHPIPSREYILQYLHQRGSPVTLRHLLSALDLASETEITALKYRLKAMIRDGQLMTDRRNRYCLLDKLSLIPGRVSGHPDGYGFVIPDDGSDKLFLSAKQMRKVLDGDRVLARKQPKERRGRGEAVIHEVLEHTNKQLVGRIFCTDGIVFVEPDNKRITQDIQIAHEHKKGAENGQIVMVKLLVQPSAHAQPVGRVIEILGEHMAPGMEIDVAIRSYGIPYEWPPAVINEVSYLSKKVEDKDIAARTDLRDLPFVTIDGEDAQDFDDAVYCTKHTNGSWRLYVAIADVSHYVKPHTALDQEAIQRGNSVYFPGRVIPMLPEILANELCSLQGKVDRLALVCEMSISSQGKLSRHRFYTATIKSKARLTYTAVADLLSRENASTIDKALQPHLFDLYELYKLLHKQRQMRGAIDFDISETRISFDIHKKIKQILPTTRNDAHRLIEECMLMANIAAARFIQKHKMPSLYRVHDHPGLEKIQDLREFLSELGLSLGGGKKPAAKAYAKLLAQIKGRPDQHVIQTVMLRSLSQAEYSEKNIGHFALAYPAYTHFTSPIRRYPDLLLHRAIKHLLKQQRKEDYIYTDTDLKRFASHCSETERRADEATRDVVDWLKCEYIQDKVGEEFDGIISGVTSFGIFVELRDVYVEGLVHITDLKSDYYQFDSRKHRLIGERTRTIYHLGDSVHVRVMRVDLSERKIDFELV